MHVDGQEQSLLYVSLIMSKERHVGSRFEAKLLLV
jgi:hypothetical protein